MSRKGWRAAHTASPSSYQILASGRAMRRRAKAAATIPSATQNWRRSLPRDVIKDASTIHRARHAGPADVHLSRLGRARRGMIDRVNGHALAGLSRRRFLGATLSLGALVASGCRAAPPAG